MASLHVAPNPWSRSSSLCLQNESCEGIGFMHREAAKSSRVDASSWGSSQGLTRAAVCSSSGSCSAWEGPGQRRSQWQGTSRRCRLHSDSSSVGRHSLMSGDSFLQLLCHAERQGSGVGEESAGELGREEREETGGEVRGGSRSEKAGQRRDERRWGNRRSGRSSAFRFEQEEEDESLALELLHELEREEEEEEEEQELLLGGGNGGEGMDYAALDESLGRLRGEGGRLPNFSFLGAESESDAEFGMGDEEEAAESEMAQLAADEEWEDLGSEEEEVEEGEVPLGGMRGKAALMDRFPELQGVLPYMSLPQKERDDTPYPLNPVPLLAPEKESSLSASSDLLYCLKDAFPHMLHPLPSHRSCADLFDHAMVAADVSMSDPLMCLRGAADCQAWLTTLGEEGVQLQLLDLYSEDVVQGADKRRNMYAVWHMTLSQDLEQTVRQWGAEEWWKESLFFVREDLARSISDEIEKKGMDECEECEEEEEDSDWDEEDQALLERLVGEEEERRGREIGGGEEAEILAFTGQTRFGINDENKVADIEWEWYILEEFESVESFAKVQVFMTFLLNRFNRVE